MENKYVYNCTCLDHIASDELVPHGDGELETEFAKLVSSLAEKNLTLSGAESCTGGLVAKCITDVSGASAVFCGAVVSYTNEVKTEMLGISPDTIEKYTEVSAMTAREMADGARNKLSGSLSYSTTGFAGPTGGTERDPMGTVYVGISSKTDCEVFRLSFSQTNTRKQIRLGTAAFVAKKLLETAAKF